MITIYIDGGAKGNGTDGAVAYGSFQVHYRGEVKRTVRLTFPEASTNNEAEYLTLIESLVYLKDLQGKVAKLPPVEILTDSQLLVGQLTSGWKVKALNLRPLVDQASELLGATGAELRRVDRDIIVGKLGH